MCDHQNEYCPVFSVYDSEQKENKLFISFHLLHSFSFDSVISTKRYRVVKSLFR